MDDDDLRTLIEDFHRLNDGERRRDWQKAFGGLLGDIDEGVSPTTFGIEDPR
ncbi:hypothetical protein [Rarobacter incanus]|nr:hypothetical protein [Rarobacter incanus]